MSGHDVPSTVTAADGHWCSDMGECVTFLAGLIFVPAILSLMCLASVGLASVATWRLFVGKAQKGKGESESKRNKGKGRRKAKNPETCLCCGKERHMKADNSHQYSTCSSCGKVGHLRAVCQTPTAHEVSDEPVPEAVVEEVWCVAVSDGHCDCTRHTASVDERNRNSKLIQKELMCQNAGLVRNELMNRNRTDEKFPDSAASMQTGQESSQNRSTSIQTGQSTWLCDTSRHTRDA